MPNRLALAVSVAVVAIAGLTSTLILSSRAETTRIEAGRSLYALHCASCHGYNLEGQPNWQTRLPNGRLPAPPHDASGHTWHHSDDQLFTITKKGVSAIVSDYESDMLGFEGVLTDDEITAVLDFIKNTWPEREREYQAERSQND